MSEGRRNQSTEGKERSKELNRMKKQNPGNSNFQEFIFNIKPKKFGSLTPCTPFVRFIRRLRGSGG